MDEEIPKILMPMIRDLSDKTFRDICGLTMSIKDLQDRNYELFQKMFGRTPLTERVKDIQREAEEVGRFLDINHLKEEYGDLLCSVLAGISEMGEDASNVIAMAHEKIKRREQQYKSLGRKTKVAILGGAFDPVTKGHIETAQLVLDATGKFDEVWLMPCYQHLFGKEMTSPEQRLKMVEMAVAVDGRIKAFDYEIRHMLKGETLNCVNRILDDPEYDNYQFSFIMGADNAMTTNKWVGWDELERRIPFVVVPRAEEDLNITSSSWFLKEPHMLVDADAPIDCSSTVVRSAIDTQNIPMAKRLVDNDVLGYIIKNCLYRT